MVFILNIPSGWNYYGFRSKASRLLNLSSKSIMIVFYRSKTHQNLIENDQWQWIYMTKMIFICKLVEDAKNILFHLDRFTVVTDSTWSSIRVEWKCWVKTKYYGVDVIRYLHQLESLIYFIWISFQDFHTRIVFVLRLHILKILWGNVYQTVLSWRDILHHQHM